MLSQASPIARQRRPRRPGRSRVAAALERRGARERLILTLLLVERLYPIEVADALGISLRQVERTYDSLLSELRQSAVRGAGRARATSPASRLRKAA